MTSEKTRIEGALNFRSVAPYASAAGRLKPDAIYRSGTFAGVTPAGFEKMRQLGVRTVFDLRNEDEKARSPSPALEVADFTVVSEPHDIHHGDLFDALRNPASSPSACVNAMIGIYTHLPAEFADIYRRYFLTIAASDTPVVIHCTAGKDRTGVAVAMLLDLLGVARDDIFEDYLKTNAAHDALYQRIVSLNRAAGLAPASDALIEPVIAADADYLNAMFKTLERDYGDMGSYARQALRLTPADVEALRLRLTG